MIAGLLRLTTLVLFAGCAGTQQPTLPRAAEQPAEPEAAADPAKPTSLAPPTGTSDTGMAQPGQRRVPGPTLRIAQAIQGVVMPPPPFEYRLVKPVPGVEVHEAPRIKQRSKKRNKIIDDEAWFRALGIEGLAPTPNLDPNGDELTVRGRDGQPDLVLDFAHYRYAPAGPEQDRSFVDQDVTWAVLRDGVLLVSHGHRTYAESSGGLNAYITAIDLQTREVLWRSAPLVSNSRNFLIRGPHVITGYGFTDEPDFLYILDLATGKTLSKRKLASGPDYFVEKDGMLHVRCYNTNYVFELID